MDHHPKSQDLLAKREDFLAHAQDLFEVLEKRAVKIEIKQTYPLAEAARAHRDLETLKNMGSTILIPNSF
ncbi:MAG: zinc-binding dehydrogenase [Pseudomonadota bacterium]